MSTRRDFISRTAAFTVMSAADCVASDCTGSASQSRNAGRGSQLPRVRSVIRRDETTLRLGGQGDVFHTTWAGDGFQYVSVCDGMGWFDKPKVVYNTRLYAVRGGPRGAAFQNVSSYPDLILPPAPNIPRYYGFGTLALEGRIYQFLSTWNQSANQPDGSSRPVRIIGAKLIYSPDNGRTWCNQDGSTPVRLESWEQRSRDNMVFLNEPQESFSILSLLQMGRNYGSNTDGYVYVYAPNGNTDGTMNQLVMFRVTKDSLLNREAYEFFGGLRSNGDGKWVKDINDREIVHTFPQGWVNTKAHPWSWHPSITYNAPLGVYMMATWGTGSAPDGLWFGKPSYLGLWISEKPWGPWRQIHEEASWAPNGEVDARPYAPQIPPKWIAEDGKSFWIVWTDFQQRKEKAELARAADEYRRKVEEGRAITADDEMALYTQMHRSMPYYSFNAQRIDLVTG